MASTPASPARGDENQTPEKERSPSKNKLRLSLSARRRGGKRKKKKDDGSVCSDAGSETSSTASLRRNLKELIASGMSTRERKHRKDDESSIGGSSAAGSIATTGGSRRSLSKRVSGGLNKRRAKATNQETAHQKELAKMWTSGPQQADLLDGALLLNGDNFEQQLEKLIQPFETPTRKSKDEQNSISEVSKQGPLHASGADDSVTSASTRSPVRSQPATPLDLAGISMPSPKRKNLLRRISSKTKNSPLRRLRKSDGSISSVKSSRSNMSSSSLMSWLGRSKKKTDACSDVSSIDHGEFDKVSSSGKRHRSLAKRLSAGFRHRKSKSRQEEEMHRRELERIWADGQDESQGLSQRSQLPSETTLTSLVSEKTNIAAGPQVVSRSPDTQEPSEALNEDGSYTWHTESVNLELPQISEKKQREDTQIPEASHEALNGENTNVSIGTDERTEPRPLVPADTGNSGLAINSDSRVERKGPHPSIEQPALVVEGKTMPADSSRETTLDQTSSTGEAKAEVADKIDESTASETPLTGGTRTAASHLFADDKRGHSLNAASSGLAQPCEEIKDDGSAPAVNSIPCEVSVDTWTESASQATEISKPVLDTNPESRPREIQISPKQRTRKKRDIFKGMKKKKEKKASQSAVAAANDKLQTEDGILVNKNGSKKRRSRRKKLRRVFAVSIMMAVFVGLLAYNYGFFESQDSEQLPLYEPDQQEECPRLDGQPTEEVLPLGNSFLKRLFPGRFEEQELLYYLNKYKTGSKRKTFF